MEKSKQISPKKSFIIDKQMSYSDVIEYLDAHWSIKQERSLDRIKKLDQALGSISQKINTILVAGTNGKTLTIHYAAQLLKADGLNVGTFYSPHVLTYNERFGINNELIAHKAFTEIAYEVISKAEALELEAHTSELLTMMALLYFKQQNVDVALLEVDNGGTYNPVNICNARIVTVTRVTPTNVLKTQDQLDELTHDIMGIVKQGTHIVSGDQTKSTLQLMHDLARAQGGVWEMPIRKLAVLPYPFEQLHGRCAALAERIAQLYVEYFTSQESTFSTSSLLIKQKGTRGRPTLEAKRHAELNPRKTVEQFWKEATNELPGHFQLLDKEKPTILLDNARNIDAFKNLLLGIRLLHYQRPLKGLTIIVGAAQDTLLNEEFLKLIRYFFKKTSGQIFICPLQNNLPGIQEEKSWDVEAVTNDIKSMKVKARACTSFEEAFELAKKSVDERNGLVVVTGSQSIINTYWQLKGIKKF